MKILFLQIPVQDFYSTSGRLIPLGLFYLQEILKKFSPEVETEVCDYLSPEHKKTIPIPKVLYFLKDYYKEPDQSPFCTFGPYYHFGKSFDEIIQELQNKKFDLLVLSSLFTPYHNEILVFSEKFKQKISVPIVVGGAHASARPETLIESKSIDFLIKGEGEKALVFLVNELQRDRNFAKVPNLFWKEKGKIIENKMEENFPLEEIPFPRYDALEEYSYTLGKKKIGFIMSSRGCPWHCSFCSVHQVFRDGFRERTVASIIEEMKHLYKKRIRIFDFEDDNVTFNKKRFLFLCEEIQKNFSDDIECVAMNGISYLTLDKEILMAMKKAHFGELNLSLVSENEQTNLLLQRPFSKEKFIEIVELSFQMGFKIVSYQILGLPSEDDFKMKETLKLLSRLPVLIGASPFYLPPESPISKNFHRGTYDDLISARLTALGNDNQKRDDIYTFFITIRILNFLKSFSNESLGEILTLENLNKRKELGVLLLRKLFSEKKLYGFNKKGFFFIDRFKEETFRFIFNDLFWIKTQEGKDLKIDISF